LVIERPIACGSVEKVIEAHTRVAESSTGTALFSIAVMGNDWSVPAGELANGRSKTLANPASILRAQNPLGRRPHNAVNKRLEMLQRNAMQH
jgi:hypothetical protein